jgi:hypothetical protein
MRREYMRTKPTITNDLPQFDALLWSYENARTLEIAEALLKDVLGENGEHSSVLKVMEAFNVIRGGGESFERPSEFTYLNKVLSQFNKWAAK